MVKAADLDEQTDRQTHTHTYPELNEPRMFKAKYRAGCSCSTERTGSGEMAMSSLQRDECGMGKKEVA